MNILVVCENCGVEFLKSKRKIKDGKKNFCSVKCCNHYNQKNNKIMKCENCGKDFHTPPLRESNGRRFCSYSCKVLSQKKPDRYIKLRCAVCNKEYTVQKFFVEKRNSKYCSNLCFWKDLKVLRVGSNNPRYTERVIKKCCNCGRNYESLESNHRKYCSVKCSVEAFSKKYNKDNHWLYKGGKSDYGLRWDKISAQIKKRDEYTCQLCGANKSEGAKLHVHHIRKLRYFQGDTSNANKPHNLIMLCRKCHAIVEKNPEIINGK